MKTLKLLSTFVIFLIVLSSCKKEKINPANECATKSINSGLVTAFEDGNVYLSPDENNLAGGGSTSLLFAGQKVAAMFSHKKGMVVAFENGTVYYTPDGQNLAGGGCTQLIHSGSKNIIAMIPFKSGFVTAFSTKEIW